MDAVSQNNRYNIFYFSDYHGIIPSYRKLKTASDTFDRKYKEQKEHNLKLGGGDLVAELSPLKRLLVYRILKTMGLDASAVGNHEWKEHHDFFKEMKALKNGDAGEFVDVFSRSGKEAKNTRDQGLAEKLLKKYSQKGFFTNYITFNTKPAKESEGQPLLRSGIIQKNGTRFGVIGLTTNDYEFDHCSIEDYNKITGDIQQEVDKLKKEHPEVNKIILLSHLGLKEDQQIAKSISGIDIIVGGHCHTNIYGIKPGYNLFESPAHEPVIVVQPGPKVVDERSARPNGRNTVITQAGNESAYGVLNVSFDDKGRVDLSKNNYPVNSIESIHHYAASKEVAQLEDEFLPESKEIGWLQDNLWPKNPVKTENPIANLTADAVWNEAKQQVQGTDFALMNAGSYRAYLDAGPLTDRAIEYCLPLPSPIVVTKYNKKDIVDALKWGADSTKLKTVSPGIFHVSGLRYTIEQDGEQYKITNAHTVNEDGKKKIQITDSNGKIVGEESDELIVATTKYMLLGPAKLKSLEKTIPNPEKPGKFMVDDSKVIKELDTHRDILIDYIKAQKNTITVPESRITIPYKL